MGGDEAQAATDQTLDRQLGERNARVRRDIAQILTKPLDHSYLPHLLEKVDADVACKRCQSMMSLSQWGEPDRERKHDIVPCRSTAARRGRGVNRIYGVRAGAAGTGGRTIQGRPACAQA